MRVLWSCESAAAIPKLLITTSCFVKVREMVEIITREFIQMAGTAGEVRLVTKAIFKMTKLSELGTCVRWRALPNVASLFLCSDGVGESEDAAQVHADDEPGVAAGYLWGCWPTGSSHREEEAATRAVWPHQWVLVPSIIIVDIDITKPRMKHLSKKSSWSRLIITVVTNQYFCMLSFHSFQVTLQRVTSSGSQQRCCAASQQ